jgi:TonB family protein
MRQEAATAAEVPDLSGAPGAPAHDHALAAHPPHGSSPSLSPREAASGFTFHRDEAPRSQTPLVAGAAIVALLAAVGGGWYFLKGRSMAPSLPVPALPVPTTLFAEVIAAQERVKELEQKLAALEAEKQAAEVKAADEAKVKVEAQAKAKGQEVDLAAVERAQEEARQRARQDEERRQREELKQVEEQKRAEEARLAEEHRRAEEAAAERAAQERAAQERAAAEQAALAAQATPPPATAAPAPAPPPTTAPVLRAGMLVGIEDPGVIGPILEKKPPLAYPPIALRQRIEGSVDLSILVDERGNVTDARVVSTGSGRAGLSEAAADYARKWKYRPATKDGVPVKVWKPVTVVFKLP